MSKDELTQFQIRMAKMETKLDNLDEKLGDTNSKIEEVHADLKAFIASTDTKFAGKWVEKALLGLAAVAGTTIIGALFRLILK